MSEKNTHLGSRRMEADSESKIQVDEHYFRHVDQMQRWKQEYDHCKLVENKIAQLSKFQYQPVDYLPLLEHVPYKEIEIPNFDHLIDEAKATAENGFLAPVLKRIFIAIGLLVAFVISTSLIVLWTAAILAFAVLASIYFVWQERCQKIARAMKEAKNEGMRRRALAIRMNEEAKKEHEHKENERITATQHLLTGEIGAVILKIDEIMRKLDVPFPLQVDIEIYEKIPLIKILLPPKTIVPYQTCELTAAGRPQYGDKEMLEINKQYMELCSSTMFQVLSLVYATIPSFVCGYAFGQVKDGLATGCLFRVGFEREKLEEVLNTATSGISAMQMLQAKFECDAGLNMIPFEPDLPSEWGTAVNKQDLRSISNRINWDTVK